VLDEVRYETWKTFRRRWGSKHMNNNELARELLSSGLVTHERLAFWEDTAHLLAAIEAIGRYGATAIVKFDGERPEAMYTVVISGSCFGDAYFRRDGSDVLSLLREGVEFYRTEVMHRPD